MTSTRRIFFSYDVLLGNLLIPSWQTAAVSRGPRAVGLEPGFHRFAPWHLQIHSRIYGIGRAVSAAPVGHHKTLEAPLFLQHVLQQRRVLGAVRSVHLVVG